MSEQINTIAKPASRNGVGPSSVALPPGQWQTIIDFLVEQFPAIPRSEWLARMQRGDVLDAHGKALSVSSGYQPNSKIFYFRNLPVEPRIPFDEVVLYQDDYLLAVDKPHFLPVTPAGRYLQETLLVRLKNSLGIDTLAPMHRIDRETAGLVLFTIQPHTRNLYQTLFRERSVSKEYEAIAPYRADLALPTTYRSRLLESAAFMKMEEVAGEANAETAIDLMEVQGALARYKLEPVSGQKHQLRAHMAALGIPIVNDRIYPELYPDEGAEQDYSQPLKLLAKTISFTDPISRQLRQFESRQSLSF
ncbi:pseudouridine synthase [Herminiimonas fonticola]|uniref:tRNA pseudouridine32 synthase/23S rRNA pseudouridine746 synthase n=1 Tax=Herminiimonas fonticola TaxID=303380 RepID=A0A4R6GG00_9BURK|nr:pseudouridine synthase [Herminiimonas fonticola]RBA24725.1 Pseudouridylate synthases 23S RNA-specific [Herminiimonas fonticola]TDN93839.1 tRNA pseudouridine32 synthase/23S rRNA pseudouridine746 synthase [Herminiimonas fonticola]